MVVVDIRLYELLKNKIGEKEAETFVQTLEEKMENKIDQRKHELATKEDLNNLREEFNKLRAELLRTIYLTSLGQLLAVIASVVTLVLLLRK